MSGLKELIDEYCPDGVVFKTLDELGYFYSGLNGKNRNDFSDGNQKFITYMNVYSNLAVNLNIKDFVRIEEREKQNKVNYGDVLFTGSSETLDECGISSVLTKRTNEILYLNSFCFGFHFYDEDLLIPNFSKYLFRSDEVRKQIINASNGVTRFNVSKRKMGKLIIPVPPLPVQKEIVRILDQYSAAEQELEEELFAEKAARRKQYEYYRDKLLTFKEKQA